MRVLGIETTCDETAAAIVELEPNGDGRILADEIISQIAAHAAYGGVVPEIAARAHVEIVDGLIARAFANAGLRPQDIDGVAAAAGPGLIGGVLVGLMAGKGFSLATGKPFVAVNHLEAHALVARLVQRVPFPYLLLLASGGHTQILAVKGVGEYERLGARWTTRLARRSTRRRRCWASPIPGDRRWKRRPRAGDPRRFALPRPMLGRPNADFSLSGLKTATRQAAERAAPLSEGDVADLCASFQAAVVDVIVDRLRVALGRFQASSGTARALVVAGGVAANGAIREALARFSAQVGAPLVAPPPNLCTDNGAMIAWVGIERLSRGLVDDLSVAARPRWPLDARAERALNNKA